MAVYFISQRVHHIFILFFSETKYSLLNLQRESADNRKITARKGYDNTAFDDASETTERRVADMSYEALELQASEQIYQRLRVEDQYTVIVGCRNTIYADAGQISRPN